jgi:general stress protein 26
MLIGTTEGAPMSNEAEIEAKFWKSLADDRTAMLGLVGSGHSQPMTAQTLQDGNSREPIWFFTSKETRLVQELNGSQRAMLHFASKDHDLFASVQGELVTVDDRTLVDRLWSPFVATWYEGGKEDPKLQLIRFDAEHAQVWLNEHSLFAGVKLLLGRDPKREYGDRVADISIARH